MKIWTDTDTARVADRYQFRASDVLLTIERPGIKRFKLEDAALTNKELIAAKSPIDKGTTAAEDARQEYIYGLAHIPDGFKWPFGHAPYLDMNKAEIQHCSEPNTCARPAYNQDIDGDTFVKFDHSKPRCELLPAEPLIAVAEILTSGAVKYDANQWTKGGPWMRCIGATLRHIFAWMAGEDYCPDSKQHHIAHAITNLMFLLTFIIRNDGTDDRDPRNKAPQAPVGDDL